MTDAKTASEKLDKILKLCSDTPALDRRDNMINRADLAIADKALDEIEGLAEQVKAMLSTAGLLDAIEVLKKKVADLNNPV